MIHYKAFEFGDLLPEKYIEQQGMVNRLKPENRSGFSSC